MIVLVRQKCGAFAQ